MTEADQFVTAPRVEKQSDCWNHEQYSGVVPRCIYRTVHLYGQATMGQQHRVRTKRKRRTAYLKRKRVSVRGTRRVPPKSKAKKQSAAEQ
jgi:hypothetical protein